MMCTNQPEVSNDGIYTKTQTMRALGICYNTLMKLIREGYIKPISSRSGKWKCYGSEIKRCWKTY